MKKLLLLSLGLAFLAACNSATVTPTQEYSSLTLANGAPVVVDSQGSVIAGGDVVLGDSDNLKAVTEAHHLYFESAGRLSAQGHAAPSGTRLWSNSTIPYVVKASLDAKFLPLIQQTVQAYAQKSNIRLVPRSNQRYYVEIVGATNPSFCGLASSIGFVSTSTGSRSDRRTYGVSNGASHYIVLNNSEAACSDTARTVVHEFGHILGLRHEHSRSDRDSFIRIDTAALNNDPLYVSAYSYKYPDVGRRNAYDYNSVMHYRAIFRKTGLQAIFPLSPTSYPVNDIGGETISSLDSGIINTLYTSAPQ
jgi:Astacin (Peptidase family M12A)